jgi:predicted GNAT superfamily acetyltransferase
MAADEPAVLALNNDNAADLSWLTPERLSHLIANASHALLIGPAEALLLAFDQDADYDSPNFLWFRERHERFVYVDRIVVSASARGKGHGSRLYRHLFGEAARAGYPLVTCEVNVEPPNPVSEAFHGALGFSAVGAATLGAGKAVRYYTRPLR